MTTDTFKETLDMLDMEYYLDREAIEYRRVRGSHGDQLNIRTCPCCGQSKWKVYIGAESGLGNCFSGSCEARFNKYSFIKAYTGLDSFKDTANHIKAVAAELGWKPAKTISKAVEIKDTGVVLPTHFDLPIDGKNLKYLEERGVTSDLTKFFQLKYCHLGILNKQDFSSRIIIPIFDLNGDLVTFQGRDITGVAERKYLFPAGLPATGKFLYNGHNVVGLKKVVMGEGAFDVIAIKAALDSVLELRDVGVVGSFGKHLSFGDENSNDQLSQFMVLKEAGLEQVFIMWDGEENALDAALNTASVLTKRGIKVFICSLPANKDPNEVHSSVVVQSFLQAKPYTTKLHLTWKLKNPYKL